MLFYAILGYTKKLNVKWYKDTSRSLGDSLLVCVYSVTYIYAHTISTIAKTFVPTMTRLICPHIGVLGFSLRVMEAPHKNKKITHILPEVLMPRFGENPSYPETRRVRLPCVSSVKKVGRRATVKSIRGAHAITWTHLGSTPWCRAPHFSLRTSRQSVNRFAVLLASFETLCIAIHHVVSETAVASLNAAWFEYVVHDSVMRSITAVIFRLDLTIGSCPAQLVLLLVHGTAIYSSHICVQYCLINILLPAAIGSNDDEP